MLIPPNIADVASPEMAIATPAILETDSGFFAAEKSPNVSTAMAERF